MSQFYNDVHQQLINWVLGGLPGDMTLWMATVTDEYVFDPAHEAGDIVGVQSDLEVTGTVTDRVFDFEDLTLTDLEIGVVIQGFIFYFDWGTGTKLICFIDTAADLSLPLTTVNDSLLVTWPDEGVFKI